MYKEKEGLFQGIHFLYNTAAFFYSCTYSAGLFQKTVVLEGWLRSVVCFCLRYLLEEYCCLFMPEVCSFLEQPLMQRGSRAEAKQNIGCDSLKLVDWLLYLWMDIQADFYEWKAYIISLCVHPPIIGSAGDISLLFALLAHHRWCTGQILVTLK